MKIDPKALIRARKNFGITRAQAAQAIGVESKTLAAWDQGIRSPEISNWAGRALWPAYR